MQQVYPPSLFASNRRFSDSFLALAIPSSIGTLERASTRFGVTYELRRMGRHSRQNNAPCVEYTYYESQAVFNQEGAALPALFNPVFALDKNQPISAILACLRKVYGHLSPRAKDAVIAALANTVFLSEVLKLRAPLDLDPLALLQGKDPARFSLEFLITVQTLHDALYYGTDFEATAKKIKDEIQKVTGAASVFISREKYRAIGHLTLAYSSVLHIHVIPDPFCANSWMVQLPASCFRHTCNQKTYAQALAQVPVVKDQLRRAGFIVIT